MEILIEVDPRKVLYSQDSIRSTFRNDEPIEDTIEGLVLGEILPSQIRCIRVCVYNGRMHSLDNRRLYAFKEAIKRGSSFRTVPAMRSYDFVELEKKMSGSSLFNDWSEIRVRGRPRTQNRPSLSVNNSRTRIQNRPSISVMQDRTSFYENIVPTRTQDRPSINVSSGMQDRTRTSYYVHSVPSRTQDRTSFYIDSLRTRTQDSVYADSLFTRTQDRTNIYASSLHTGTPSSYASGSSTRTYMGFGNDYTDSETETPKKESWCTIM
ncbi:hypothetical protein RclHR1_19690002 [Rhizophagus clarus]|uniref:Uncharacterized protein n=1 Tax=Rhizophagus clarus TaxID=94130 RepID=A0A2Z6RHZ8_9GLOM|nr:hypothetical protein RclHR1_19690002 [Rhizophagus clarus]